MDFTVKIYKLLIQTLQKQGFLFQPFCEYNNENVGKIIILRQDVDSMPLNSLCFAQIQAELGIKSTFYFRTTSKSFDVSIIKKISKIGHEIGYHYEDLNYAIPEFKAERKSIDLAEESAEKELVEIGISYFTKNLEKLRNIVPINTICMHGSPINRYDSRLLWKYYDYKDFGISGEPYFDIDFNNVLYLTDTGRKWNGNSVSVRDKVLEKTDNFNHWKVKPLVYRDSSNSSIIDLKVYKSLQTKFHSTSDIIRSAQKSELPEKIMMTFHPQRWTNELVPWMRELILQNLKNVVKYFIVLSRKQN